MADDLTTTMNTLVAQANGDLDLRARLLADPVATIGAETGLTVPDDWHVVASEGTDGSVNLGFANDELPLDYLELVSGGLPDAKPGKHGSGC